MWHDTAFTPQGGAEKIRLIPQGHTEMLIAYREVGKEREQDAVALPCLTLT